MATTPRVLLATTAMLWLAQTALANTIVFDNFGPDNTYSNAGTLMGNYASHRYAIASDFVPTSSGTFDELWTAMFSAYPSDPLTLTLTLDESGWPGAVLWSGTFTNVLGRGFGTVLHLDHIGGPQIDSGSRYWLEAVGPSVSMHYHVWNDNVMGDKGALAVSVDDAPWVAGDPSFSHLVMRIGIVPEPSTVALLGVGAISLLGYAWLRKQRA